MAEGSGRVLSGPSWCLRSAELRALVLLGVGRVREALLEDAYNEAVDAGDFDDTRTWVEQTTTARRRRRASA